MYENFFSDVAATGPILLIALVGVIAVVVDSFKNDSPSIPWIAAAGMVVALVWEVTRFGSSVLVFEGQVAVGGLAAFANAVILLGAVGSVMLSVPYLTRANRNYGEVHALILFATCGAMVLASAGSLITMFVGLETMSICLYVLTGLSRERQRANESALKYFILGAFSTGFFLYGIALMYGATGTMQLAELGTALEVTGRTGLFVGGVALLMVGFFFKVSAVPFHMWTPDVYQGAPTTLTAFMSTISKTAAFAALIAVLTRVFAMDIEAFAGGVADGGSLTLMLAIIAAVTMVVGNVIAISQNNVKRMLAYSSIAHAGYILAGLAAGTADGYSGALYYLLAYTVMNLGAFGVLSALEWDAEEGAVQTIDSLAGMGYRKPLLGISMGVFMFALTGFPPLAGFIGKYLVFAAAINAGLTWLAVIGVLASIVSAFYYLRVLVAFWMRSPEDSPAEVQAAAFPVATVTTVVLVGSVAALLGLGILPGPVIEIAQSIFAGTVAETVTPAVTAMLP
ncbi:NADH-quinone oxidoreductase subunit N [soil metagenome]